MNDWKAWIREIAYDRIDQIERHLNACPEAFPEFAVAAQKIDAAMEETGEYPDARLTERDDLWISYSAALALEMYLAGTRDVGACIMRSLQVSCRRFRSVRRNGMNRPTHEELDDLRSRYPKGSRVKLIRMDDPYCQDLKPGMLGTVMQVDDIGTIHVSWDCGSSLGVVFGEDSCTRIDEENNHE